MFGSRKVKEPPKKQTYIDKVELPSQEGARFASQKLAERFVEWLISKKIPEDQIDVKEFSTEFMVYWLAFKDEERKAVLKQL